MNKTTVVSIRSGEPYDEYVGTDSQWEIPTHIKGSDEEKAQEYEKWIQTQQWLMDDIPSLRGKIIACDNTYQGDVLARLANNIEAEEVTELWKEGDIWYILHNNKEICMNAEDTAKMMLRLLKEKNYDK
jgi:hypothetical protein